jgi:hypothetical protein
VKRRVLFLLSVAITNVSVACSSGVATLVVTPCGHFVTLDLCVKNQTGKDIPEPSTAVQVVGEDGIVFSQPRSRVTLIGFIPAYASSCGPFGYWDLTDTAGAPVQPGTYTVSVVLADHTESTRTDVVVCERNGVTTTDCAACTSADCLPARCVPPQ